MSHAPICKTFYVLRNIMLYFIIKFVINDHTSGKWEISDQKNDQNIHINDHFWFGNRWWLIYGLLLRDQNWSFFILVIYNLLVGH